MAWKPDNVSTVCQILFYLEELGHENMSNLNMECVIETTNYTVMCCSKTKGKAAG